MMGFLDTHSCEQLGLFCRLFLYMSFAVCAVMFCVWCLCTYGAPPFFGALLIHGFFVYKKKVGTHLGAWGGGILGVYWQRFQFVQIPFAFGKKKLCENLNGQGMFAGLYGGALLGRSPQLSGFQTWCDGLNTPSMSTIDCLLVMGDWEVHFVNSVESLYHSLGLLEGGGLGG